MPRLPFDDTSGQPTRRRPSPSADETDAPPTGDSEAWSVSEAARRIKGALTTALPKKVRIVGEVSNFSDRNHWFFSLKEGSKATLRCVCFASSNRRVRVKIEDGMEVVATGRVDYYDAQGQVQLYVDQLEPVGQGALELQLRRLLEELREAGYFDESRKKKLPVAPMRIAVVTSRSAAALQDIINTKSRRFPGVQLLLRDVRVQGAQAAPEVAAAIDALTEYGRRLGIDALIVTRGGGSIEDLWAFNDRAVAEAIYRCPLPIVAAIGHETDTTVAELVADARCATPTQAATVLIPDRASLIHQVDQTASRLSLLLWRQLQHERSRLDAVARYALFRHPGQLVADARRRLEELDRRRTHALPRRVTPEQRRLASIEKRLAAALPRRTDPERQRLTRLTDRLTPAIRRRFTHDRDQLTALEKHLDAIGPHRVLQRGYSYTLGPDGRLLRHADQAHPGDQLTTVLQDGRVTSRVEDQSNPAEPQTTRAQNPSPKTSKRRPSKPKTPPGPGLFDHT